MWVMTEYGFFSVVCAWKNEHDQSKGIDKNKMMIRARSLRQITKLRDECMRGRVIIKSPASSDYPYRIIVSKLMWESLMTYLASNVKYGNFKNHIHKLKDSVYEEFLMCVWAEGFVMQDELITE